MHSSATVAALPAGWYGETSQQPCSMGGPAEAVQVVAVAGWTGGIGAG